MDGRLAGDDVVDDVLRFGSARKAGTVSVLSPDQIVELTEGLVILLGVAITWLVYHGSDRAELPGEATIPEPGEADDAAPDTTGRTLS